MSPRPYRRLTAAIIAMLAPMSPLIVISGLIVLPVAGCGQHFSEKDAATALAERGLTPLQGQPVKNTALSPASPAAAPAPVAAVVAPDSAGFVRIGALVAALPESWVPEAPSSSMRVAQFVVSDEAGGRAELAVFSGNWGTVDDNIARWVGQFRQPDGSPTDAVTRRWEVVSAGGIAITMVDIPGTYGGGMGGGGAQTGYRMLGAIVPAEGTFYYLKFIGPSKLVAGQSEAFASMVHSLTGA